MTAARPARATRGGAGFGQRGPADYGGAVREGDNLVRDTVSGAAELRVPLTVDVGIGDDWMAAKG